mgnify:CR=1 FL=1|tara:strand:+ start:952 stop:1215 length:264 start_codon:yes stop_codon:yes gene_type:complete
MSNLKTIRVNASMITDLYMDINVPVDVEEDDLSELITNYELVTGAWMHRVNNGGDWVWQEEYDIEFDPKAPDFTEEVKKLLKVKNNE